MTTAPSTERGLVRVLIVDDTADIRLLLRFTLERAGGFEVVDEAGNGREAQELAATHRPDVILLDLAMPVMDGLEALPGLRRIVPEATIIVLSGFTADRMTDRAISAGADGYVQKGASPKQIVERIRELAPAHTLHAVPDPPGIEVGGVELDETEQVARLRQLLATVAHEIRNPVFVLMGVADALESEDDDIPAAQRSTLLAAIGRQARVLERVTGDLLTSAQNNRGTLQVHVEPVEVGGVIASSINGIPGLTDTTVSGDTDARVLADPVRLQQILANLLSNAMKYGRPPITIRVERQATCTHVTVEDRGPGVPLEFHPRLFTEFFRAPGTDRTGNGLGLYVVRSLTEAQGGLVSYADVPGGGAAFTVALTNAMEGVARP
jgi:signal transduction histidine kinase